MIFFYQNRCTLRSRTRERKKNLEKVTKSGCNNLGHSCSPLFNITAGSRRPANSNTFKMYTPNSPSLPFGLTQESFRELSFSRLECGVHDTFPVQTGGIFYFPWHRHQTDRRQRLYPAFSVSSERHRDTQSLM